MFIFRFSCPNCQTQNTQEIVLVKNNTVSCATCGYTITSVENVNGCILILSNRSGLVTIIFSPLNYKLAVKRLNKQFDRKSKFKLEAVFSCKKPQDEFSKINKNRKLKKSRSDPKSTCYNLAASEVISIISSRLKKAPTWVYNRDFIVPRLPGV